MRKEDIFSKITMPDILSMYNVRQSTRRRIPCPLHDGVKKNFSYNDKYYICWSCGAKGNVIEFVMEMFGLDFPGAIRKIECDFNLTSKQLSIEDKCKILEKERLKIIKDKEKIKKNNYYNLMINTHRILYHLSQIQKIEGLKEYLYKIEEWLDDNTEEINSDFY